MTFLYISLLSFMFAYSFAGKLPEYVKGTQVNGPKSGIEGVCSAPSILECHDCTHMRVCSSDGTIAALTKCSGATPFCNNNKCSAVPDQNGCSSDLLCPKGNSFFPNPSNCKAYHFCDESKMVIQYQCPPKYVWNQKTAYCKLASTSQTCVEVDCKLPENKNQLMAYPGDNSLYLFCDDAKSRTIIYACDEGDHFESETLSCEFACQAEGHFVYKDDCSKFNACYLNSSTTYAKVVTQCPTGLFFHPETKVCDSTLTQCYKKPGTGFETTTIAFAPSSYTDFAITGGDLFMGQYDNATQVPSDVMTVTPEKVMDEDELPVPESYPIQEENN